MNWYSRKVLTWRISNTLDVHFCLEALQEALSNYGKPEIFNSDQGSQFTSKAFTDCLKANTVQISMDGRGCCHDNIFIERLWRSIKYELIYLRAFEDGIHLNKEVGQWFEWYNQERFHQALDTKHRIRCIIERIVLRTQVRTVKRTEVTQYFSCNRSNLI